MSNSRIAVFLGTVLGIWAVVHLYVFWRAGSVPWVAAHFSRKALFISGFALWISYPAARTLNSLHVGAVGRPLEMVAANWIGILFLLFSVVLVADILTLGGWPLPRAASTVRTGAFVTGLVLSIIGLVQGLRPPVIQNYEVTLPALPKERDGLVMVDVSDIHLDGLIGPSWTQRLVDRVNDLKPDIVVAVGDIVDGEAEQIQPQAPVLRKLHPPLGVWAVTGNHEYYAGLDRSVKFLEDAGCTVLRDRWAEPAPGLILAGVDDLGARPHFGPENHPVEKALAQRPPGGVVLLCHTPIEAETAAASGAGLMLSGHTHNGQVWPFTYLVKMRYPLLAGRYEVKGMPVIVCRGTGTWGPRMRLWQPGEILKITLRSPAKEHAGPGARRSESLAVQD